MSPQQRHLWRLQTRRHSPNAQLTMLVVGPVDDDRLSAALAAACGRHEVLRTGFHSVPGMALPLQAVNGAHSPQWRRIDLHHLPPQDQDDQVARLAETDRNAPFDLIHGPVVRPLQIDLGAERRLLVLTLPALSTDRVSLRKLAGELAFLYTDQVTKLDPHPLQVSQIAEWQDDLLASEEQHALDGRAFWSRQTDNLNEPPALPFRCPAPVDAFERSMLGLDLPPSLVEALDYLARQCGVSAGAVLETLWAALLARFTGATELHLGHECDGRSYPELENALACLTKTLPIRLAPDPSAPLTLLLRETDSAVHEALGWEEYYSPESSDTEHWLPYRFGYEDVSAAALPAHFSICDVSYCAEAYDLGLGCRRDNAGLRLDFSYDSQRRLEADVRRLAAHYQMLLGSALGNPTAPIGLLNSLPEEERQRVLLEWNPTERQFPSVTAVHHLFEQAARQTPDATAVIFEGRQLTYARLNARANQLARSLQAHGVGPDVPVGLCLERSDEMIVGLLGILKAGGAYVPLDPGLPSERLEWMLADSGARLLVSQARLPALHAEDVQAILLDRDAARIAQESEADLNAQVCGEHLVYVIYTSGSTGRPKGVAIEHRNLVNYVQGIMDRLNLEPGASFATVSTIAADLGNTALFPALCSGGCLHIVSQERAMDPGLWKEYFQTHTIDCLKIVPSHLAALLGGGEASEAMLPRQVLVLGGETSGWELVQRIEALSPELRIFNHYGPTETTVGVLTYAVETGQNGAKPGSTTVPLGCPLPNSRAYLLNEYLQPLPIGVAGELYIGGAGVGREYLNRAELTAERFVRDPFSAETGERLYKTGDMARYLADGKLEFLGRADDQVKIRGFRIELGEIESVLRQHPGVREAVVLAREDSPGEKRLAAYVVLDDESLGSAELREHLRRHLPEYMLPPAFVTLRRLPLTLNGKVDRKALPAPYEAEAQQTYIAPRNPVEETLHNLWGELLRRAKVSVEDNFFELGGHSLMATQVISRVREAFGIDLPLRALFELPTIAGLAVAVGQTLNEQDQEDEEELERLLADVEQLSDEEARALLDGSSQLRSEPTGGYSGTEKYNVEPQG